MPDPSTAVAVENAVVMDKGGIWRILIGRLAAPCVALWRRWDAPDTSVPLHRLGKAELLDMGASPELTAEAERLREFEAARANALYHYYW